MELQEALDRAVLGVVKQGRLAVNSRQTCFYQMENCGPRCAIGQLLDDDQLAEIFRKDANCASVYVLVYLGVLDMSFRHPFFKQLQSAHDTAKNLDDFLAKAKALAARYNLTFPEVGMAAAA